MDAALKELAKLEKLVSGGSSKGKSPSIDDSLDSLLYSLREVKDRLQAGTATDETFNILAKTADNKKKEVEDRQKEIYNTLGKVGKALDKKFSAQLPSYDPLFSSPEAHAALEHTIALHFLRIGQFHTAETFIEESSASIDPNMRTHFIELDRIISALRAHDIEPALAWTSRNRKFLDSRLSPLEFLLHRSQYVRLLLSSPSDVSAARSYAMTEFPSYYSQHGAEIGRLMACMVYHRRLHTSPYADLASSSLHLDLEPMFATEYCASLGMSRQVPLRVIGDLGGGGALARIEKGRKLSPHYYAPGIV
ncbi:uncharacterized protein FIBRA_01166 [Fibroporia radiculosa]|uniref:CTLH domain-containing protein n=1 Tax=Fibroporia radiculosa TaxID=599839 RepID=J4I8C1_9APHY|nr:uncharacterized protein FIBRA_01166 [Fibroporia radiculosa]CCL99151.1 predicted protein [Fibroporia radiculosa]